MAEKAQEERNHYISAMCAPVHILETRLARIHLKEPGFIEQRFRTGAAFAFEGLHENRQARLALSPDKPYVVLTVLPSDLDLPMQRMEADQFGSGPEEERLRALAIVSECEMGRLMVSIYSKYLNFELPAQVFDTEEAARQWLKKHMV